jgi:hypothetical protein
MIDGLQRVLNFLEFLNEKGTSNNHGSELVIAAD